MENKRNGALKHFGPATTVSFLEIITVKGFLNLSAEMALKIFNKIVGILVKNVQNSTV